MNFGIFLMKQFTKQVDLILISQALFVVNSVNPDQMPLSMV